MAAKVLITGASGFVGRHLINRLYNSAGKSKIEIFGTCYPDRPEHCLDLLTKAPSVKLIHIDLRSESSVDDLVKSVQPDHIFHLAAISQVRLSWERRRETLETNLMGTFFLFEAVRKYAPRAKILFVSTSTAYGFLKASSRRRVFREEDRIGAVSPYALTKIAGELLSEFYSSQEGLGCVVARTFHHVGPGQSPDFVCSEWARQIALIEKDRMPPYITVGNLELCRDYSDVRDIVAAYVLLLRKGRTGEVYNVCSGNAPSLKKILGTLLSFSSRRIEVRIDPAKLQKSDIPYLAGSNEKLRKQTGWQPRIPLEKTLRDLLEDWRKRT